MAVHPGARIGALAGPGEVLASRTVRDLPAGSGLTFESLGPGGPKLIRGIKWSPVQARHLNGPMVDPASHGERFAGPRSSSGPIPCVTARAGIKTGNGRRGHRSATICI
jgi:hypothetical protein